MGIVEPGDVVESHVAFDAKSNAYEMLIGCVAGSNKGWSERSIIPVAPHRGETRRFTNVFFVVEHPPKRTCEEWPRGGRITFRDIHVQFDGVDEPRPRWEEVRCSDPCGSDVKAAPPEDGGRSVSFHWRDSGSARRSAASPVAAREI